MEVTINGNAMVIPKKVDTITKLIEHLEINNPVVIVEHNDVILQKESHENTKTKQMRIIMLKIGPYTFNYRLFLGTGKFPDFDIQKQAVDVSETEVLTFAVQRMNIFEPNQPNFLEKLDLKKYKFLPNTAG